jgi:hypothetical protein
MSIVNKSYLIANFMDNEALISKKAEATKNVDVGMAFMPASILENLVYSRAIEAVNWGIPVVNFELMYQAANKIGQGLIKLFIGRGYLTGRTRH